MCGGVRTAQRQRLVQISTGFCTHFMAISIGLGLSVGQSEWTLQILLMAGKAHLTRFRMISGLSQWIMTTKVTLQSKISENISR